MNNPTLGRSYTTRISQADSDVPNRGVDLYKRQGHTKYETLIPMTEVINL